MNVVAGNRYILLFGKNRSENSPKTGEFFIILALKGQNKFCN